MNGRVSGMGGFPVCLSTGIRAGHAAGPGLESGAEGRRESPDPAPRAGEDEIGEAGRVVLPDKFSGISRYSKMVILVPSPERWAFYTKQSKNPIYKVTPVTP
jgi:hypothetical protein